MSWLLTWRRPPPPPPPPPPTSGGSRATSARSQGPGPGPRTASWRPETSRGDLEVLPWKIRQDISNTSETTSLMID